MKSHARTYEWDALSTYNSEVARGIVHTPEWDAQMAAAQERFSAKQRQWACDNGYLVIESFAGKRSEPSDVLRISDVRDRLTDQLRKAPNDAHYMQVVVGLHDLAALLDDHKRIRDAK